MEIQREKLFDEVWATPITHLCKRYGLSDQGLRKTCIQLQIPLPQRGHWARIAAGHLISKPELPPLRPRAEAHGHRSVATPSAIESAFVNGALLDVDPPTPPLKVEFHPALAALAREYEQADIEARQLHAKFLWESAHPGKRYTGKAPVYPGWQRFCDSGRILRPTHKKSLLRVSMNTYKRALRVMQELIGRLQIAGYEIVVPKALERLQAKRGEVILSIKVVERLDAGHRKEVNSWSKEPRLIRTLGPTGRLTIGIEQMGFGESQISDRQDEQIESQWDRVMTAVAYRYERSLAQVAEWARFRQECEDHERDRQERLRLQEERRRAEEAEQAKRQALLQEARNWGEADMLRAYLRHLEQRRLAGGAPADGYATWASWAEAVAVTLDGSDRRVSPLRA